MSKSDGRSCIYCGLPIRNGSTCYAHRDIPLLDPLGTPARKTASEVELGVRNQHKVPKRGGRDELY